MYRAMKDDDLKASEVVEGLRRRDHGVFRRVFERYYRGMTLFGEYFLCDREEAEDVAQEVFTEVWEEAERLPEVENVRAWLLTRVKNKCLNRLKHLEVEDAYRQWVAEAEEYAEAPEGEVDEELAERVKAVVEELPEQAKRIFKRVVLDDKRYREVAEELGVTVNTVNTQMTRAYRYVRRRLGIALLVFIMAL